MLLVSLISFLIKEIKRYKERGTLACSLRHLTKKFCQFGKPKHNFKLNHKQQTDFPNQVDHSFFEYKRKTPTISSWRFLSRFKSAEADKCLMIGSYNAQLQT